MGFFLFFFFFFLNIWFVPGSESKTPRVILLLFLSLTFWTAEDMLVQHVSLCVCVSCCVCFLWTHACLKLSLERRTKQREIAHQSCLYLFDQIISQSPALLFCRGFYCERTAWSEPPPPPPCFHHQHHVILRLLKLEWRHFFFCLQGLCKGSQGEEILNEPFIICIY